MRSILVLFAMLALAAGVTLFLTGPDQRRIAWAQGTDNEQILSTLDGSAEALTASVKFVVPNVEVGDADGMNVAALRTVAVAHQHMIETLEARIGALEAQQSGSGVNV